MIIKKMFICALILFPCSYLEAMKFDPNKALIVSASILDEKMSDEDSSKNGVVQFWNPITGDCLKTIKAPRNPYLLNYFQCNDSTYKVLTGLNDRFQVCTKNSD